MKKVVWRVFVDHEKEEKFLNEMSEKGWALTLLGSHHWGDGYVQGTDFDAYNWFVNLSKRINDHHQLSLTAFGAPQKHYQRSNSYGALTIAGWQKVEKVYGIKNYKYNCIINNIKSIFVCKDMAIERLETTISITNPKYHSIINGK